MGILREVLAGICAASGKDKSSGWLVASYKDKKDLAYLWSDEFLERVKAGEHRNLVVVWDGMPEPDGSGVNVLDHITPVDWAMALSHRLLQESKKDTDNTIPELRILICDISQQNHASAFSVRMLPAICHGMPWLRVYRPIKSDNWFMRNFEALVNDIKQFDPTKFPSLKDAQLDLVESLVHAWIGSVAESGSHHDVSNLLGPMVLSVGFNIPSEDKPARIALLTKIIWLDIGGMAGRGVIPRGKWFDFAKDATKIVCDRRVKIILIDDQANQGWLDIVSAAVGAERSDASEASEDEIKLFAKSDVVEVHASKSYLAIKSRLEDAGISDEEGANINGDQRFKFSLTGEGAEILLLDLRLFFNEQDEIKYFKWALGVVRNLKRANGATFPDMATDKLDELRNLIEEAEVRKVDIRKATEYFEFLTLLPRILATVDMSLPIVIFSSSGQRQVAELLKPYGNIITVFEKPRFFGYVSDDIAGETQNKFSLALVRAVKMLHAREFCIDLIAVPKPLVQPIQGGKYNHVEIFIDEDHPDDGNLSQIYVGGCIAIYTGDSKEDALAKADKFDEVLVTGGARYFDDLGIGKKSPRIKAKKSAMKSELEMAMQAPSAPKFLGVVRLLRQQMEADGVAGDMTADNHFRRTLSLLLEVFLCEVLPRLFHNDCSEDNTSTSIFVGTRVKFYNERKRAAFEEVKSRLGLSGFSSHEGGRENYYLTSMDRGGVFPIVADLHQFRHPKTEITRSIGVMLCYHTPAKNRAHPLYFICRNCKEVVSYTKDHLITRATFDVEAGEIPQNIAEVTGKPNNREFGFIRPIGASEDSIFYKDKCAEFDNAKLGKLVTYGGLVPSNGGKPPRANDVRLVDEETSRIIKAAMKTTLPRAPICLCVQPDFVPDYRALHYLADEALDKFPSEANSLYSMLQIIFDDNLDEQLESLVEAGRELDNGDKVSALIKVSHALHNNQPVGNAGSYILARFPDVLENITNQDYWRMAQQL